MGTPETTDHYCPDDCTPDEWEQYRQQTLKRDGYTCQKCGYDDGDRELHADHQTPMSRGGSTHMDNLQTLCFPCHNKKTKRDTGKWIEPPTTESPDTAGSRGRPNTTTTSGEGSSTSSIGEWVAGFRTGSIVLLAIVGVAVYGFSIFAATFLALVTGHAWIMPAYTFGFPLVLTAIYLYRAETNILS